MSRPWLFDGRRHVYRDSRPRVRVCTVWTMEREADGHLIAAAPELLSALDILVELSTGLVAGDVDPFDRHVDEAIELARQAIAKARGE